MNVVAVGGGVLLLILIGRVSRQLDRLQRDLAAVNAAIRKDVDDLHTSSDYAREEQMRVLTDVEQAATHASNEVRIAAGTVRAVTDRLAEREEVNADVIG